MIEAIGTAVYHLTARGQQQDNIRTGGTLAGENLDTLRKYNRFSQSLHEIAGASGTALGAVFLVASRSGDNLKSRFAMQTVGSILITIGLGNLKKAIGHAEIQDILESRDSVSRVDFEDLKWAKFP